MASERDIRIGVVGNVDAGKSTLIGVLTSGNLDDGRGQARQKIFRHQHEASCGRTSSVSYHIMGFDEKQQAVHQLVATSAAPAQRTSAWRKVIDSSESVITFIDLAGHEKYLKTTIGGLAGCHPDYVLVLVGANMGVSRMTREHIGVAIALELPLFVVITKIDICPPQVMKHTLAQLFGLLKSPQASKMPVLMRTDDDIGVCLGVTKASKTQAGDPGDEDLPPAAPMPARICPVFLVSSVKGTRIPLLQKFLGRLRSRRTWVGERSANAHLQINEAFVVDGVGIVVSGTVSAGVIQPGMTMVIGPFANGSFLPVVVRSLQSCRTPLENAEPGVSCTVSLRSVQRKVPLKKPFLRRGMVLLEKTGTPPKAYREFEAEIVVLHHPTTIKPNYQAVVHCGSIRQTAQIEEMDRAYLRTGDRAVVRFRFMLRPEFIPTGSKLIFREGGCKCIGRVSRVFVE